MTTPPPPPAPQGPPGPPPEASPSSPDGAAAFFNPGAHIPHSPPAIDVPPPVYMPAPYYPFAVEEPPPPYMPAKDVEAGAPAEARRMRWSRTVATVAIIVTASAVIAGGLYGYHQGI